MKSNVVEEVRRKKPAWKKLEQHRFKFLHNFINFLQNFK